MKTASSFHPARVSFVNGSFSFVNWEGALEPRQPDKDSYTIVNWFLLAYSTLPDFWQLKVGGGIKRKN